MLDTMKNTIADPMILWNTLAEFLPSLLTAIALLIGGYFIDKIICSAIEKLLNKIGINKLADTAGFGATLKNAGVKGALSGLIAKIVYWLIFLTFIISACDALGLDRVSATIDQLVLYLPKVISALILTMVGLFIASFIRTAIEASLGSLNLGYEKTIGGIIYALIVVIVVSLAINQLEIETDLLNQVVIIFLLAGASAVAIALGLGTKQVAGNVVAGVYARELYQPGITIKIDNLSGKVIEITSTALVIQSEDGRKVTIPNTRLIESQVEIISE